MGEHAIHRCKSSLVHEVPELHCRILVEHHITGREVAVRNMRLGVHALQYVVERELVAIVVVRIAVHHRLRELSHCGRSVDAKLTECNIGLCLRTLAADYNRRQRSLGDLVWSSDASSTVGIRLGEIHRSGRIVQLHEHVVVALLRHLLLESVLQERSDARVHVDDVHPLHALALLPRGT